MSRPRPKLGVWKFASCDGCQLTLLDCEDELLALAGQLDIAYFKEATRRDDPGPFDIGLVEGSITTSHDVQRIRDVRRRCRRLVVIGACATAGGIQALRNFRDSEELCSYVYPSPAFIDSLATSTPIADHVAVDFELRGCPIDRAQLLEVIAAFLCGRKPLVGRDSVCMDCKRAGHVCVTVSQGIPCLGPITQEGCGALCPGCHRGCYGCFGPRDSANTQALTALWRDSGIADEVIVRQLRTFNAAAPAFRSESERHE
ncbi:MAG: oxidoreductase [Halieaceae bacterium]|jgi:coenzyme F420-reducing hydrogenase gamma subunit|nr:oxidoreductase [Halieaceae bacterium]